MQMPTPISTWLSRFRCLVGGGRTFPSHAGATTALLFLLLLLHLRLHTNTNNSTNNAGAEAMLFGASGIAKEFPTPTTLPDVIAQCESMALLTDFFDAVAAAIRKEHGKQHPKMWSWRSCSSHSIRPTWNV